MARRKKMVFTSTIYIRKDILDKDCDEVGLTVTLAIERILDDHLEKHIDSKIESILG